LAENVAVTLNLIVPKSKATPLPMVSSPPALSIDMLAVDATCAALRIEYAGLLRLVSKGELAAYDLGEGLRFRARDIKALAGTTVKAA